MKKRMTQLHRQPALTPALVQRFQKLAGGIAVSALSKALMDQPQMMLAHPPSGLLLIVIAVAILGTLGCAGWRNIAKVHRRGR